MTRGRPASPLEENYHILFHIFILVRIIEQLEYRESVIDVEWAALRRTRWRLSLVPIVVRISQILSRASPACSQPLLPRTRKRPMLLNRLD